MSGWKKLAQAAAGGESLNVEDVFAPFVYKGNSSQRTITNGIDLSGEGGLVWTKSRSTQGHVLCDTAQGTGKYLSSNQTWGTVTNANVVNAFNSDGYSIGSEGDVNANTYDFASWTFRKAPKFFTCLTYTGNGTAGRTVSHNLGSVPGCIIVKRTDTSGDWAVFHRSLNGGSNPAVKHLELNGAGGEGTNTGYWNDTDPTSTVFSVGINSRTNANGGSYVAYLFAHNNGDGEFGPTGDQDIVKCGSYTGNGTSGHFINLGFEPQWLMIKRKDSSGSWWIWDDARAFLNEGAEGIALRAETSGADTRTSTLTVTPSPKGFTIDTTSNINGSGDSFVYVAIRRGPMAVPESRADVFEIDRGGQSNPSYVSGFRVDMGYDIAETAQTNYVASRLRGTKFLKVSGTGAEVNNNSYEMDFANGMWEYTSSSVSMGHMWRRAPNFFDVALYTGTGSARTVDHNLGVAPEMMWVKKYDGTANWQFYHSYLGNTKYIPAFYSNAAQTSSARWNNTTPTATQFTVGTDSDVNGSGSKYIAFLFATLNGISKVGGYTGTGSNINIDCGFSNGAKYILIKRTDTEIQYSTEWYIFDTEQGISTGNDPYQWFNLAPDGYGRNQVTNTDYIDPLSSGFTVTSSANSGLNASGGTYVFYAIAT